MEGREMNGFKSFTLLLTILSIFSSFHKVIGMENIKFASEFDNLQVAVDSAKGKILIIDRDFTLDSHPVYIGSNTVVMGDGISKIYQPKEGENIFYIYRDTNIVISNLNIKGTGNFVSGGRGGIKIEYAENIVIERCSIESVSTSGIVSSYSRDVVIRDNNIIHPKEHGIYLSGGKKLLVENNFIYGAGKIGIQVRNGGSGEQIINNRIINSVEQGILIDSVNFIKVFNNEIGPQGYQAIKVIRGDYVMIMDNILGPPELYRFTIEVEYSDSVYLLNNKLQKKGNTVLKGVNTVFITGEMDTLWLGYKGVRDSVKGVFIGGKIEHIEKNAVRNLYLLPPK
jgi:nitrous oxidase accessory protein NosD